MGIRQSVSNFMLVPMCYHESRFDRFIRLITRLPKKTLISLRNIKRSYQYSISRGKSCQNKINVIIFCGINHKEKKRQWRAVLIWKICNKLLDTKHTEDDLTRFTCSAASIRELRSLIPELKLKVFQVILCTVCQQLIIIFREHISQLNVVPIEYFPKLCAAPNLVITL